MSPQDSEKLAAGLRALAARMEVEQPSLELENALRFAFQRRRRMWRRISLIAAGAAAASILVAVATVMRHEPPRPVDAPPAIARSSPAVVIEQKPVEPPAAVVPRVRTARRPQPARREIVTEFFPIAGNEALGPLERGGIVRIRIPRSALMVFGLPMNEARATELIKADVVMGEDGLARAIRFVQ